MNNKRISDQIQTIRVATEKANASPETALAFLKSAGIVLESTQIIEKSDKKVVRALTGLTGYQSK